VAQVALTRGLDANLVHKWRRTLDAGSADAKHGTRQAEFVPVALAAGPAEAGHIHLKTPTRSHRAERDMAIERVKPVRRLAA
jgi:hypothetical protein